MDRPLATHMHTHTIQFIRRGEVVSLGNVPPTRTLLEVLREDLACTGTKEGCGEGDCGACTVVLGEADGGTVKFSAINSCIRFAHSIDGMALWTVEDLAADPLIERAAWRRPAAPRTGSHGAVPRLPMRVLHAGFCDEPVWHLRKPCVPRRDRHPRTGPS